MARYNYSTKQCEVCGCDIPNVGTSKYCISCGIEVRQMRQRERYRERMAQRSYCTERPIASTIYSNLAPVFRKYGYPMPSWEEYIGEVELMDEGQEVFRGKS